MNNISIFDASNVDDVDNRLIIKENTDDKACLTKQVSNTGTGSKSRARGRFGKIAPNANHPLTISMRRMKDDLQLTTKQLVSELDAFEREYGLPKDNYGVSRDYIVINPILMSSYLQGWVLQAPFISAVHNRLHRLYEHKTKYRNDKCDFNELFPEWFKMLGIPDSDSNTRLRTFSRVIAPYYKRAVLTRFPGVFRLGQSYGNIEQEYTIEGIDGIVHHFVLNRADEILIEDGSVVSKSDLIQYAILYPIVMKNEKVYFDINSPSADHTKFFRWYQYGKSPRSLKDVELVKQAVIDAAKAATQTHSFQS